MDNVDFQAPRARIPRQFGFELRGGPDQKHTRAVMTRRLQGAFDLGLGCLVGPHRIQSDYARHGREKTRTSL
jgi:hypothetical protein